MAERRAMDVTMQCRNAEVPEALRAIAREKVTRIGRRLDGWDHAEIQFAEERNPRITDKEVCEVTLRGHGHIVRAKAAAPDTLGSIDRVVEKLDRQVSRLKSRLIGRSHPRHPSSRLNGSLNGSASANGVAGDEGDGLARLLDEGDDDGGDAGPRFVKTKHFSTKPMTPEEATLQMDLVGHDFYFFTSAESGLATVVYRRDDGHFGLIDGG
ncbi:MAG TPA: ribosome-associated translation inhibitor RaiA [Acidimicrobiales bacterium]|nr:ribosome-associated translation inhibitor RaiA [Acidimicrobiales bacterium]